jgi:hypothetical protein
MGKSIRILKMNFIGKNTSDSDKELFFGPLTDDDTFIIIEDNWIMAHILHKADIFPSISQARKNGWNKSIPEGFTMLTVGKKARKKHLFIFVEKKS